jgi:hypothetical protein
LNKIPFFSMDSKTKFVFAQTGGEVNGDTESQPPEEPAGS